jgi:DNA-binding MarR family transcriptional regulator
MQNGGLIKCRADAEDGRAVRVRLTPLARSLEPRLRKAQVRVQRIMYAGLSAGEIRAVKRTLARMASSMREHELHRPRHKKSDVRRGER